jgi:ATP-dependent DNA helicase RecG
MRCQDLFDQLNILDEHPHIDAKTASEVSSSVMQTICAFANEPGLGGGYLLLGVKECGKEGDRKYCVAGIDNPDKIQRDLADQCATRFNRVLRPECVVEVLEGKPVIAVFVPEVQPGDKPVYFKKVGLPKGAFRRIGSTNQHCTDDDLVVLNQENSTHPYDETILSDTTVADLDPDAIAEYRRKRREIEPNAEELRLDDSGLLESLNCLKRHDGVLKPTVAGVILFGSRAVLRKYFPMMRLDYIRVSGREWVDNPDHPFDTIEMRDPLFRMIPRGQSAIMDDIPVAFSFTPEGLTRQESPRIPPRVIREALVNALMHRSYQIHGPIEVIRFANRLEIHNPGHSLKPVEHLGEPGSKTRNPNIASVLHETNYAETKGSGIRVMQELMKGANLTPPTFESDRETDQFTATFLMHHFLDKQDVAWLAHFRDLGLSDDEARILIHAREKGGVNNAVCREYTRLDTLGASGILRRLRDLGLLQQHPHASMTYYTPTPKLLRPEIADPRSSDLKVTPLEISLVDYSNESPDRSLGQAPAKSESLAINLKPLPTMAEGLPTMAEGLPTMVEGLPTMVEGLPTMAESLPTMVEGLPTMAESLPTMVEGLPTMLDGMPANLITEIRELGLRSPPSVIQAVVIHLCSIRPFTADELAQILQRNKKWVKSSYLVPLIRDGILEYTLPGSPKHPDQAYRTKKMDEEKIGMGFSR